ncbi:MAG: methyltransferase domain-containing protein [Flavobacteriales bacterium]|nr:methyltransferase domain-containing protein [Flavobacteriales bacterium]
MNAFLNGKQFSEDAIFDFNEQKQIIEKLELLKFLFRDKSLLHVGFADHLPIIESRIQSGQWVHGVLSEVVDQLYGIDIEEAAIDYLKQQHKITNIFHLDIETDPIPEAIKNRNFDYVFLGEIVEHLNNPVQFLSQIRTKLAGTCTKIVITVPNAYSDIILNSVQKGQERINTDHRYWFTPFTASKVLVQSGFVPKTIYLTNSYFPLDRRVRRKVMKNPLLNHTIVVEAYWPDASTL